MSSTIFIAGTLGFLLSVGILQAQEPQPSIHQQESEFYARHPELVATGQPPPMIGRRPNLLKSVSLSKIVYGFQPYWISDATAQGYSYSLLSHAAYFSAEVDTSITTQGGFSNMHGWATTQFVTYAKGSGVKVHLTVTMFAQHARVLNDSANRANLIFNILAQINLRSADGANIDFEGMPFAVATGWKLFIFDLGTALHDAGKELVVELPAVDWSGLYSSSFLSLNNAVVDYYFLMAYDYYWSTSTTAGPVSPLTTGASIYHVMRSVNTYLGIGVAPSKMIAGVPYYGYDWPVAGSARMATATGAATARTYSAVRSYIDTMSLGNKFFDMQYNVPWYRYLSGSWRQTWYDDAQSLAMKYDSVKARFLAGSGIWALGYDGSYSDLWAALENAYASPPTAVELDAGGPMPDLRLSQNFPNPFNPLTTIEFSLPEHGRVVLKIFNMLGQEVATLLDKEEAGGIQSIRFDGSSLPSGVYVTRLQFQPAAGRAEEVWKKMLLVK